MGNEHQPPLVPAEVDLRDFAFMPLDVLRLRDSELAATPDAEAFRCNVLAWCVAWHQMPAASLPDDDATLARLLGFGRDVKGWKRVRASDGLRGWVKCSDGRLYHPVVAEKACDAWSAKLAQRARTEAARKAREEARQRQQQSLSQTNKVSVTEPVTESKGQGQGQGQGQGDSIPTENFGVRIAPAREGPGPEFAATKAGAVGKAFKAAGVDPTTLNLGDPRLLELLRQGAEPAEFEGLAREAVRKGIDHPFGWCLATLPERRKAAAAITLQPRAGSGKHSGFAAKNYREGVSADGSLE